MPSANSYQPAGNSPQLHTNKEDNVKKIQAGYPETMSQDVVTQNIEQLQELFPDAWTEGKLDFEVLKQLLGGVVDDREEKFGLNWHGKRNARRLALTPSSGTLRPCPDESVEWDMTQNLLIEGDNLEVLKLLQKSYSGKVKMIYIDPPYNTGHDFVYPDDYQDSIGHYLQLTGQIDGTGAKLTSNPETSGRFHSNWLSMIYPRLKLAKNLLRDDGVIFISCGDKEIGNLVSLVNDIFGEENRIGLIARMMKSGGAKGNFFTPNFDYILVFARQVENAEHFRAPLSEDQIGVYYNKLQVGGERAGETYGEERLYKASLDPRANQRYWIKCPDGSFAIPPGKNFPSPVQEGCKVTPTADDGVWKWVYSRYAEEYGLDNIVFKETSTSALVDEKGQPSKWNIYNKVWLKDQQEKGVVPPNYVSLIDQLEDDDRRSPVEDRESDPPSDFVDEIENRQSSAELKRLGIPFDFAKPSGLIEYLIQSAMLDRDDIVLDFFAGSGTTGHSVMRHNLINSGRKRFILVQLPEQLNLDDPNDRPAAVFCQELKKPLRLTEITKERLRRSGNELLKQDKPFDSGFRVFKLDSSCIRTWSPNDHDFDESLLASVDHIHPDRDVNDVLYELLLKLGLDLCVPIEQKTIAKKVVHSIGAGALVVCLDTSISNADAESLAHGIIELVKKQKPAGETSIVFRDSAFADDVTKTNVTAILQQHGLDNVRSL